jgi:hypothetical protein
MDGFGEELINSETPRVVSYCIGGLPGVKPQPDAKFTLPVHLHEPVIPLELPAAASLAAGWLGREHLCRYLHVCHQPGLLGRQG